MVKTSVRHGRKSSRPRQPDRRRRAILCVEQLEERSLLSYSFQPLAYLGDPLPRAPAGSFVNDFEPGGVNNHGDIAFGADASTGGEGIFLRHQGQIAELAR